MQNIFADCDKLNFLREEDTDLKSDIFPCGQEIPRISRKQTLCYRSQEPPLGTVSPNSNTNARE
jgi:hypothetical protein